MDTNFEIEGRIVDVVNRKIYEGRLIVRDGKISEIIKEKNNETKYILPGFIDSHVHIESSMLIPSRFARGAVRHGVVGVVCDPHEIANVLGIEGIDFMIENAAKVPFKFYFGVPSCVPATEYETSGFSISYEDAEILFRLKNVTHLSEMMNYPGVINEDQRIIRLLNLANNLGKPIDGHAPGLRGELLKKYIDAGITTDHEVISYEEGEEKIKNGMKILIREGSAAKNFDALIDLLRHYPDKIMFCSDDKHPNDLLIGYIDNLCSRAVKNGIDLIDVLRAASYNPVIHYKLDVGLLQAGDPADFIVCDDLVNFKIKNTYVNGIEVYDGKSVNIKRIKEQPFNHFVCDNIEEDDIKVKVRGNKINVIGILDNSIYTERIISECKTEEGYVVSDLDRDILKIVVMNRYRKEKPVVGFVKNFGLKSGAVASTIAHDSHNIVCIGVDDFSIVNAIRKIIDIKGGIVYVSEVAKEIDMIKLPYAGLMTNQSIKKVSLDYRRIINRLKRNGVRLSEPCMTMSFLTLLVIPEIKMSDKGLFNSKDFNFIDLFVS